MCNFCGCSCCNGCGPTTILNNGCYTPPTNPCVPNSLCPIKIDTNCVLYNYSDPNATNCFTTLGLPNGSTLSAILCAIDAFVGGLVFINNFSASSNSLVIIPGGVHGFTPSIELVPSTDVGNTLVLGTDHHPYVPKTPATQYVSTDAGNAIIVGTDSKLFAPQVTVATNGCLSFAETTVSGVRIYTPTIDYVCLSSHLPVTPGNFWGLAGNSGTIAGTNFIGTSDNKSLVFKTNNVFSGVLDVANANTIFGINTPSNYGTVSGNTAFGFATLSSNSANNNTALGSNSLQQNTNGTFNTGVGTGTLGQNIDGNENTAIGNNSNDHNTHGSNNTSLGYNSLIHNTIGNSNTAIGNNTLSTNVSGSNNTVIGDSADVATSSTANAIALGSNAIASANQLALSPQIQTIKATGLATGVKYVLTDVAGDGNLSLQPVAPTVGLQLLWIGTVSADGTTTLKEGPTGGSIVVTSTLISTGHYRLTHNIGNTKYFITGSSLQTSAPVSYIGSIINKTTTSFDYLISDDGSIGSLNQQYEIVITGYF